MAFRRRFRRRVTFRRRRFPRRTPFKTRSYRRIVRAPRQSVVSLSDLLGSVGSIAEQKQKLIHDVRLAAMEELTAGRNLISQLRRNVGNRDDMGSAARVPAASEQKVDNSGSGSESPDAPDSRDQSSASV